MFESAVVVIVPSPLVGEGIAEFQRRRMGEGFEPQATPHPLVFAELSATPSPTIRAFTPVFDGLWGEGTRRDRRVLLTQWD